MKKPVIICIDDEATVLESIKVELKKALGDVCVIETAEGGQEAIELFQELLLEETEVALVLSDYIMPDIKGDEVLKRIHEMSPNTLTVMLTGQADLEAISKAIKNAKLYRYIAKPWQPEDLKLTVIEAIHSYLQDKKLLEQNHKLQQLNEQLEVLTREQARIISDKTAELQQANEELRRLANIDGLTQIANRRKFDEVLTKEWEVTLKAQQFLSLILLDVDNFKLYNDFYGHLEGDKCLKQIAQVLANHAQESWKFAARYGGEEFAIILSNTTAEDALSIAEKIRMEVVELKIPHVQSCVGEHITVSMGVSTLVPEDRFNTHLLIDSADRGLFAAKRQGRNRVVFQAFMAVKPSYMV